MRIGIDLGGTKIEAIALANDGTTLFRQRIPSPQDSYDATLSVLCELITKVETSTNQTGSIGIGIPGTISSATGLVKNANSTWLIGKPLNTDLQNLLKRPLKFANDANCFALSEAVDGAARGARSVFGVILGTGVGGGIVINEEVITGPNAIAGEWGHNPMPWITETEIPGDKCYCGKSGCIETFLNGTGFIKNYPHKNTSAQTIADSALEGNKEAILAINIYAERLARALAAIINVLDPEVIVLGGGLSNIELLYECVPKLWQKWIFSDEVTTKLVKNQHGDSSGVRGAAWLWPTTEQYSEMGTW